MKRRAIMAAALVASTGSTSKDSAEIDEGRDGVSLQQNVSASLVDVSTHSAISDRRIHKVLELVSSAPHHTIPVLAQSVNLSASRLEHLFKQYTNGCLREHIIKARVHHAERLLQTTELSIKEIAAHLGYAHSPSFIRVFTAARGQSPRRFRDCTWGSSVPGDS